MFNVEDLWEDVEGVDENADDMRMILTLTTHQIRPVGDLTRRAGPEHGPKTFENKDDVKSTRKSLTKKTDTKKKK